MFRKTKPVIIPIQIDRQLELNKFATALKTARLDKKISQGDLALKAGLHRNYIGFLERAEQSPSLITMIRISRALEISTRYLFNN